MVQFQNLERLLIRLGANFSIDITLLLNGNSLVIELRLLFNGYLLTLLRLLFLRLVVFSLSRESFLVCQVASIQNLRLVLNLNLENTLLVLLIVLLTCGIADSVHRFLLGLPFLFGLKAVFLCFGDSLFFCRKAAFTSIFQIHSLLDNVVYLL